MPANVAVGQHRGYLIPIGGAEDKDNETEILTRFLDLCGDRPRITVVPTASKLRDTGRSYRKLFKRLGAYEVDVLRLRNRDDCNDPEALDDISCADGIFMTGGNQLRLSSIIGGTPVAQAIRRKHADGTTVAGTSAGAAIMPEHMIAGGRTGPTPRSGMVQLSPGLGLTNRAIIDQHFRQRDRLGRLMAALAYNPFAIGLGIDEDTAAFIDENDVLTVVGSGAVTVVDPGNLEHSSIDEARSDQPLCLLSTQVHVLPAGAKFDLSTREPTPPPRD